MLSFSFRDEGKNFLKNRVCTTLNFLCRATSIIPWTFLYVKLSLYMCLYSFPLDHRNAESEIEIELHLFSCQKCSSLVTSFIKRHNMMIFSACMVVFSIILDVLYFRRLTWSAWNFLEVFWHHTTVRNFSSLLVQSPFRRIRLFWDNTCLRLLPVHDSFHFARFPAIFLVGNP